MLIKRNHLKGSTLHLYRNSEVEKKEHECSETRGISNLEFNIFSIPIPSRDFNTFRNTGVQCKPPLNTQIPPNFTVS